MWDRDTSIVYEVEAVERATWIDWMGREWHYLIKFANEKHSRWVIREALRDVGPWMAEAMKIAPQSHDFKPFGPLRSHDNDAQFFDEMWGSRKSKNIYGPRWVRELIRPDSCRTGGCYISNRDCCNARWYPEIQAVDFATVDYSDGWLYQLRFSGRTTCEYFLESDLLALPVHPKYVPANGSEKSYWLGVQRLLYRDRSQQLRPE